MGTFVHECHDAHPQVAHGDVGWPDDPRTLGTPGQPAATDQHAVDQEELEVVRPGLPVQLSQQYRRNTLHPVLTTHEYSSAA